ncbi:MAG TPA: hypothetical protein VMG12_17505 [Polyangiaceae bacterium]|nr:hypothetical protein [Polyangiaceae bacterium]
MPITSDAEAFVTAARASERALVHLGSPGIEHRGKLERFVVDGIEAELGRLGAAPPGWRYDDGLESIASDQLYRARLLGHSGLALRFESLSSLADAEGQLGAEDSRTIRRMVATAEREPLQLYLPQRCAELQIIGDPEPLGAWLPPSIEPGRVASIEYDAPGSSLAELEAAGGEDLETTLLPPRIEAFIGLDETPVPPSVTLDAEPEPARGAQALQPDPLMADACDVAATPDARDGDRETLPSPAVVPSSSELAAPALAASGPAPVAPRTSVEVARGEAERIQRCATWATQLQGMSGPKVHGSIEKAFITSYLPLSREIAAGVAPPEAAAAAKKWAEGFAQGYASAFRQLGSRPRRPMMVKDVVDVGVRWLGQHHARQCQLLLVSAMRFDVGQRLNEEIEQRLGQGAVCADQCVLWTALPSNADSQQLGEPSAARRQRDPRAVSTVAIEPWRVGNRSLFKLDHVPNDLARPGEPEAARLERLARELADVIVPWMREQPPETLMVVFGDHGFHWQAHASGTSAAQCGGALPEQVLVPASAWLLREQRQRARVAPGIH